MEISRQEIRPQRLKAAARDAYEMMAQALTGALPSEPVEFS
jgi:hypothetical protein